MVTKIQKILDSEPINVEKTKVHSKYTRKTTIKKKNKKKFVLPLKKKTKVAKKKSKIKKSNRDMIF